MGLVVMNNILFLSFFLTSQSNIFWTCQSTMYLFTFLACHNLCTVGPFIIILI